MAANDIQLTNLELFASVNRLLAEADRLREIKAKLFSLASAPVQPERQKPRREESANVR